MSENLWRLSSEKERRKRNRKIGAFQIYKHAQQNMPFFIRNRQQRSPFPLPLTQNWSICTEAEAPGWGQPHTPPHRHLLWMLKNPWSRTFQKSRLSDYLWLSQVRLHMSGRRGSSTSGGPVQHCYTHNSSTSLYVHCCSLVKLILVRFRKNKKEEKCPTNRIYLETTCFSYKILEGIHNIT